MARFRVLALSLSILSLLVLSTFCFAAQADRITGAIATGTTVRLSSGVPMLARPQFDQGAVDPSMKLEYITLLTTPTAAQKKAINKLLADQQNPHSANYHKWLTPQQYADRFGLSQTDMAKLVGWLQSQGFTIERTANARNWIAFSGTAAQVESTFQIEIHNFKVKDEVHFANTRPAAIPAALQGIVTGFRGFNNIRPKAQNRRAVPAYSFSGGNYQFIAPGDITTIYDAATLYNAGINGSGQKLAVMGETGIFQSDLTNFRQSFGLSAISCTTSSDVITACNTSNFKYVLVNGTATEIYGDLPEADLDIEWSGATAPGAQVIYVTANSNSGTTWDSWYYAVDNQSTLGESVITMSYTSPCELAEDPTGTGEFTFPGDEAELAQANLEGITFMNSSGDTGVAECDYQASIADYGYQPAYPASSQYVTGVGGTLIPYTEYGSTYWNTSNTGNGGSAKSYIPEQAWNDSLEFAIFCEANQSVSFCSGNGVGGGPLLTDWDIMQEDVIGIAAGGGGPSNCVTQDSNFVCQGGFPQPSWQASLDVNAINPNGDGMTTTPSRFTPDVSLLASANWPGYIVCTQLSTSGGGSTCDSPSTGVADMLTQCITNQNGNYCSIYGGTSISSPIFAGMMALLNQYVVAHGIQATPGLGNVNPMLYSLAANNGTNGAFNPVTTSSSGSYSIGAFCDPGTPASGLNGEAWPAALQCPSSGTNLIGFNTYDFDATTKYNLAVGLGSVNISHLAAAWSGSTLDATTTVVTSDLNPSNLGDTVTFTATVTTAGTNTPTGTVTFKDGNTTLGTGTLGAPVGNGIVNSATATYATSALQPGTHSITGSYGGDSNNAASTSSPLSQVVNAPDFTVTNTGASTSTVLAGVATGPVYGFTVTPGGGQSQFAATVNFSCAFFPGDPTLTNASCTFNPASIPAGTPGIAGVPVTVSVTTAGPNSIDQMRRQQRKRADSRMPWLPMSLPLAGVVMAGFAGRKRSKHFLSGSLCLALVMAGFLVACGGGNSTPAVTVGVSPSAATLFPNDGADGWPAQAVGFTATVSNSTNTAVTWSLSSSVSCSGNPSPCGTVDSSGNYTAPTIASGLPSHVTVTATSQADTTKSASSAVTLSPTTVPGTYTMTVTVTESVTSHNLTPAPTVVVQ